MELTRRAFCQATGTGLILPASLLATKVKAKGTTERLSVEHKAILPEPEPTLKPTAEIFHSPDVLMDGVPMSRRLWERGLSICEWVCSQDRGDSPLTLSWCRWPSSEYKIDGKWNPLIYVKFDCMSRVEEAREAVRRGFFVMWSEEATNPFRGQVDRDMLLSDNLVVDYHTVSYQRFREQGVPITQVVLWEECNKLPRPWIVAWTHTPGCATFVHDKSNLYFWVTYESPTQFLLAKQAVREEFYRYWNITEITRYYE